MINFRILLKLLIVIVIISGCSNSTETIEYEGDPMIKATLKVLSTGSKEEFMDSVGDLFISKYPNIQFELVPFNSDNILEVTEKDQPDVFILKIKEYRQLIEEDQLKDIDILLSDDRFNVEGIVSGTLSYVRDIGKRKLYGIPAQFTSKALYYNKDLFDQYGVPYPEDQMTWEEVFQLAQRFPSQDGVYGFYSRDFGYLVDDVALSRGLAGINAKEMRMNVDSKSYREVFQIVLNAYNSNAVILPELSLIDVDDPFITGTAAMTVEFNSYITNTIHRAKSKQGNAFDLNWDIVTAPVHADQREISPYMTVGGIYALNKESTQQQAAWEFVKFATGEDLAKIKSRTSSTFLPARVDYIYNPEGKRMESFYKLEPERNFTGNYDLLPTGVHRKIKGIISSEIKAAILGVKTLDEAISSMQERGQQMLDQH